LCAAGTAVCRPDHIDALAISQKGLGAAGLPCHGSSVPAEFTLPPVENNTAGQPLVVPVLQLHSPQGTTGNPFGDSENNLIENGWLQDAENDTTFNAVLVMGDSPSRPLTDTDARGGEAGESGGGLHNFPRFIEDWGGPTPAANDNIAANFSGSMIQSKKSIFATGPFNSVDVVGTDRSLFFDEADEYMDGLTREDYFAYRGGSDFNKSSFYRPPTRAWGYDVALLFQSADLFSKRFVRPSAGTPNEFYREVGRNDPWIQTLMCAAESSGSSYAYTIASADQRPSSCPAIGEYSDSSGGGDPPAP
ncbi:MAG: hypothetical protein F6K24_50865, partial [Okeania sp. SIO2D1]|nr:hypothetical protein [Okeania sp. SIO2D1]